jgi:hypothetical protein
MKEYYTYKYNSSDELKQKIDEYFKDADEKKEPYTVVGLQLYINVSCDTWNKWMNKAHTSMTEDERESFYEVANQAKKRCERWSLNNCLTGKGSTIGCIFNLKCNHGYIETTKHINENREVVIENKEDDFEYDNE